MVEKYGLSGASDSDRGSPRSFRLGAPGYGQPTGAGIRGADDVIQRKPWQLLLTSAPGFHFFGDHAPDEKS
jgi:hypothetical protein